MKMRKKLAAVLAAAMIASVMPMTAFAASTNRVSNTISIEKDESVSLTRAPIVEVKLKDALTTGSAFYLNLDGAEWLNEADVKAAMKTNGSATTLNVDRSSKTLRVVADQSYAVDTIFTFRLLTKVTGSEATIEVDGAETTVSNMAKTIFATSSSEGTAKIADTDPSNFSEKGEVSTIKIEEPYTGAFKNKTTAERTITLELRDTDFEFVIVSDADADKGSRVEGKLGFTNLKNKSISYTAGTDRSELTIVLPDTSTATAKGLFEIKGIEVRAKRSATKGDVNAILRGKLIDGSQEVVIAKHSDFTTKLAMKKDYEVQMGKEVEVEFSLSEEIANSLLTQRSIDFTLSNGAKFKDGSVKVKGKTDKTNDYTAEATIAVDSNDNYKSFKMNSLSPKAGEKGVYNFKATLLVPNNFEGEEIMLTAEGRALTGKHEIVAATVKKAVTVTVEPMDIKVGLQKQVGGKIVIKETEKESILRNYKDAANVSITDAEIRIQIGDNTNYTDGIRITDADIKVTEGDLVLDLDKKSVSGGVITIPVKRQSTVASTIEITNIEITANRMVPEGKYNVKVGGSALSKNTEINEFISDKSFRDDVSGLYFLDPIVATDFINVTTKNPEDITSGVNRAEVKFVVGSDQQLINGQAATMDAPPYIKDGNTMVPVRYVATALGINKENVIWDQANQTATIIADKMVQVKLGSKAMNVNGINIPMDVAAELTEDRTFVPMGAIARALGVVVEWDNDTKTATFNPAASK